MTKYDSTGILNADEARRILLNLVNKLEPETVSISESLGRVLAEDIASDIDINPFDSSMMDGFAVRHADIESATAHAPVELEVITTIAAGTVFDGALKEGQAARIMTGAPIPKGADTIIKVEDVDESAQGRVRIFTPPPKGNHVRPRAEEARAGEVLLHSGAMVGLPGAGLLASTGHPKVSVYRRPRVAIFSTGTELVDVDEVPVHGQIRNSNTYSLEAAALDAGAIVTKLPRVEDTRAALTATLREAVKNHDMVVLSGGAAEGDFDFTTPVLRELGELYYNKISMRPGKAQTLGVIDGVVVFGLPGNPAAAMVGFEFLLRPALRKMQGFTALERPIQQARLTKDFNKRDERRLLLRAKLSRSAEDGTLEVTPEANQSSGILHTLNNSNCLLDLPDGKAFFEAGAIVNCIRIDLPEGAVI